MPVFIGFSTILYIVVTLGHGSKVFRGAFSYHSRVFFPFTIPGACGGRALSVCRAVFPCTFSSGEGCVKTSPISNISLYACTPVHHFFIFMGERGIGGKMFEMGACMVSGFVCFSIRLVLPFSFIHSFAFHL